LFEKKNHITDFTINMMKLKFYLFTLFFLLSFSSIFAQGIWNAEAGFPLSLVKYSPATAPWRIGGCFSINNKGYVVGGGIGAVKYSSETWQFDPFSGPLGTWTQMADFECPGGIGVTSCAGGQTQSQTMAFVIGDSGYVCCGANPSSHKYLYRYDPASNSWAVRSPLPVAASNRTWGNAFAINGKGYCGLGSLTYNTTPLKDMYEYDPSTDAWTAITPFPGAARWGSFSFGVGNHGYVISGDSLVPNAASAGLLKDVWEYTPSGTPGVGTWLKLADFPGTPRAEGVCFANCGYGYVATGWYNNQQSDLNDFWEFNPRTKTWKKLANMPAASCMGAGFAIKDKCYIGLGFDVTQTNVVGLPTFYQWTPDVVFKPQYRGLDTAICAGNAVDFADSSHNHPVSWSWTFSGASISGSTVQNPSGVTFASPGTYTVSLIATDSCGNSNSYSQNVIVKPVPVITVSPDASICLGNATTLTASGGSIYVWASGTGLSSTTGNSVTANPTTQTTYTVTGATAGCSSTATVTVNLTPPLQLTVSPSTAICFGHNTALTASGAINYNWSPATGLSAATGSPVTANPTATTTYTLTGNTNGCTGTISVTVTVNPLPATEAGKDTTINLGQSVVLKGSGKGSYNWSPPDGLSCTSCAMPTANPVLATKYILTVTDTNGCLSSDTVFVNIHYGDVYVPSAFSPNGDNENDVLYVRGNLFKTFTLTIFDRWGKKVFESFDASKGWDGTCNGKKLDPAVFVYYLVATTVTDQPISKKGNISLIK